MLATALARWFERILAPRSAVMSCAVLLCGGETDVLPCFECWGLDARPEYHPLPLLTPPSGGSQTPDAGGVPAMKLEG